MKKFIIIFLLLFGLVTATPASAIRAKGKLKKAKRTFVVRRPEPSPRPHLITKWERNHLRDEMRSQGHSAATHVVSHKKEKDPFRGHKNKNPQTGTTTLMRVRLNDTKKDTLSFKTTCSVRGIQGLKDLCGELPKRKITPDSMSVTPQQ